MASQSLPSTPAAPTRLAKYLLFSFIGLMALYVLRHNEAFLVNPADPSWPHYEPIKWYLLPHGLAGALALLLGPMQFSERLRKRYTKFHRVAGRFYVLAVCVAAPMGLFIQYFEERFGGPRSFTMATFVDATLWFTTTMVAFLFIRAGKVQQHRQWMTRSFAVAIAFLEIRVIGGLGGWDQDPAKIETIVWTCVAFSLLAADLVLQAQEMLKTRRIAAPALH